MNKEMQQAKNNCSTPADADSVPLVFFQGRPQSYSLKP